MKKHTSRISFQWKDKKSLCVYLFLIYFIFIVAIYYAGEQEKGRGATDTPWYSLLWCALSFLALIRIETVRRFFRKQAGWLNGVMLLPMPIVSFFLVEIMVGNTSEEMFSKYGLYNVLWFMLLYYTIFALIRSSKYTLLIGNVITYLAAVVNYLVYLFRGNPIIPSDLLAWRTGMSVASNYELSFTKGFMLAALIMFAVMVLGLKLESTGRVISKANRIFGLGLYSIFFYLVYGAFFQTDLIETKIRVIDYFAPKYTYSTYGTAFGFVANAKSMITERPKGYQVEQVERLLESTAVETNNEEGTDFNCKPNLIAIMSEAFSDLSMVGNYEVDKEYLPYTSKLQDNTTKGTLYVSVFGGATSDTEYEFLTGNSMAVMPRNSVPYQQFITEPTDSLASTLKSQGYYNVAMHPYKPSGYKRDLVYHLLGFDEFLSEEDFEKPQRIRSYISDRESYQKIIELYEKKGKDQPLFIFNVTMQNHGGYSGNDLFDEEETVRLRNLEGYQRVEQYLSLLRETDKAFGLLVDYFSEQTEPTIILLFGDHQPVVFGEFHDAIEELKGADDDDAYQRKYMVPFILWANYDISEDDVDKISANYLSSYLLKTAGLKGTAYNNYLMDLYEDIPVITSLFYIDQNDKLYRSGSPSIYSNRLVEYKYVGYNDALDKKDKLKKYYRITDGG